MSSRARDGSRLRGKVGTGGDPGGRDVIGRLLYRLALLAYPARRRRDVGRDMEELFLDLRADARRSRGRAAAWLLTLRAVAEALWRGAGTRIGRISSPARRSAAPEPSDSGVTPVPGTADAVGGREEGGGGADGRSDPGDGRGGAGRRILIGGLIQDVRYALRTYASAPTVAVVAVAVFALGIGANTAVFSVVEAALLRSLPYDEPERLVDVNELPPGFAERGERVGGGGLAAVSTYRIWREQAASFDDMAVYTIERVALTGLGDAERIRAYPVSSNLFPLLGVRPMLGRGFTPEEDRPGAPRTVVVGHALWTTRLGRDPDVVGRTVTLDGDPYEIVGVMPPGFRFPVTPPPHYWDRAIAQVWLPLGLHVETLEERAAGQGGAWILGRLQEGVDAGRAQQELERILQGLEREGRRADWVANVTPLHAYVSGDVGQPLLITLGAVALVLLVACANVANLLLARATARQREMSVRMALGASWQRLMGQMLVESVLLALAGGVLGALLAYWTMPLILALSRDLLPRAHEVGINPGVLAATVGATFLAGILAGCAPAVSAARRARSGNLTPTPAGGSGDRGLGRATGALVVAQVSLTLMLLAGAGLLTRSLAGLLQVETGFRTEGVAVVEVHLPDWVLPGAEERAGWARRALEAARALPGVEVAAVSNSTPFESGLISSVTIPGAPGREDLEWSTIVAATPGYFELSGIPLRRGDLPGEGGVGGPVAVIDEAAAEAYFPEEDPLGRRIATYRWRDDPLTIVGIVGNSLAGSLREAPRPHVYVPLSASPEPYLRVMARTTGEPGGMLPLLREAVQQVDPLVPVEHVTTLATLVADSVRRERFYTILLGSFAVAALLMAGVGIFGVMRYAVSRRTREMGIRIALGARNRDIFGAVVGRGLLLTVLGIVLGLLGAAATTRLLSGFLYGLSAWDPVTFGGAATFLAALAVGASLFPAWRATRVDPVRSLRAD